MNADEGKITGRIADLKFEISKQGNAIEAKQERSN